MATNSVFSAIVPEVLIEENYATWSACIQNYLLSQDLWDIIEPKSTSRGLDWRKKNATALHAIQISCGSKLLDQIMGYKSAKEAWDFLAKKYSPIQGDSKLASSSSVQEEEWLNSITRAKENKPRTNESQPPMFIRKVPPILRTENFKTCYEPRVVSIGPCHHNCDPRLQQVEELKPLIAKQFVEQHTMSKEVVALFHQFKEDFDNPEKPSIIDFYAENVRKDIDREGFKRMMFLDGCFILYFIYCIRFYEVEKMGLKNHLIALVQQDLFLVENQLPFKVLEILSAFSKFGMYMVEEFIEDMNPCVRPIWMRWMEYPEDQNEEPLHLLDSLWIKLVGNKEEINIDVESSHENKNIDVELSRENKNHIKRHLFHGVKELTAARIHIRPNSSGSLRDIKFKSFGIFGIFGSYGTLTLPRMTIERSTRQMFLNLIAHEACMDNRKKFGFTSYICFLDLLIDYAEDVKALRTAGILENYLDSDEEVAKLFNEIAFDLLPEVDTYKEVKLNIQHHLGDKRKMKNALWMAEVKHDHCRSPWTIIALLASFIFISLAFVQTYFTIFPHSN